jgi:predicted ester cyclase
VRRWCAERDKGNPTIEDALLPPDDVDHDPPLPGMVPGREGVKQANALLRAAFPDTVHTIEDPIAEGDKVMTRLRGRGAFQGEILGIPPHGKVVTIQGIAIHRMANGQCVEPWGVADTLSFLQQMDALPPLASRRARRAGQGRGGGGTGAVLIGSTAPPAHK